MPHYADGTEAKIGDMVKGVGYNVKHEIIGKVVNVRPGDSCTLSVATVTKHTPVHFTSLDGAAPDITKPMASCHVVAELEFGDTKCFTKIA